MVLWREREKQSSQLDHGGFADFSGKPLFFCLNRASGGGEKKEENAQVLGLPAMGSSLPSSMEKKKPASKVAPLRGISEVDAKGRFPFFHCASVGIPKTFAYFFFFLLPAWVFVRD
ncbi:hypothetical protein [Brevibacillus brevis]|uniref:hypothetical protein n=1 Tax=Brevibacillus brevis TaxID=1393 RepID=UPI0025A4E055|nr:hypothetical protein [Brevibacillus brevis]WJQ84679.1 hypothetical protein QN310_08640 [Brevibacillus brevis]